MNGSMAVVEAGLQNLSDRDILPGETITTLEREDTLLGRNRFRRRAYLHSRVIATIESEEEFDWFIPILSAALQLLKLPENWDSYGASRIDAQSVGFALRILIESMQETDILPSVVPTTHGGIQFEWQSGNMELEVEIQVPWKGNIFFVNEESGIEQEYELLSHLDELRRCLDILAADR